MDIHTLMYFKSGSEDMDLFTSPYCVAVTEEGQVFYCEANEQEEPNGNWRLVRIDLNAMRHLH